LIFTSWWIGQVELAAGAAVPIRFGSRMDRELLTHHSAIAFED